MSTVQAIYNGAIISLSNTATPYYYGLFKKAVMEGKVPINRKIEAQMNRIDMLIENPNIYYSRQPVEGYIQYCESELCLTDGSPMKVLDSYKLWAEDILGWFFFSDRSVYEINPDGHGGRYVKKKILKRLRNKQFLIVGRGGSKTLYDTSIQSYFQNIDPSTTDQVVTAPTMRQSEETLNPLKTAIMKARGPLFKLLTKGSLQNTTGNVKDRKMLCSTKKGIENFITNSVIRILPMRIDALQGLRCKIATVDELLSCDIRESPIDAIAQGCSKLDDWLIIVTSSEGTVRNGCGDTIEMELDNILKGEYFAPEVSIWWYRLDNVEEVGKPAMWPKANPNIGITVTYETYQLDVERAEKVPSVRNDILAKRFGIPTEGYTYFFAYEETLPHGNANFWQMDCYLGADMSQGDDFCSFLFLFPLPDERFGIKTINFISSYTFSKLPMGPRAKYEEFIKEGSLYVKDGTNLPMVQVYDDVIEYIEANEYSVLGFGYDPYNAQEFVNRWIIEHGEYGCQKVPQGVKTETVPLGELKKLAEQRKLIFDQSIMSFGMGNAITLEDTNGNRKLWKKRRDDKIDPVAAMIDAYVAYKHMSIF